MPIKIRRFIVFLISKNTIIMLRKCFKQIGISDRLFHTLGIRKELADTLIATGFSEANEVQKKAIPAILNGGDVVLGAETGSGKTLAYLVPFLNHIQQYPVELKDIRRPVGLILVPSQDLADQVSKVVESIMPELLNYTCVLTSKSYFNVRKNISLVVATPSTLLKETQPIDFAFTDSIVVDEADMLLGGGFFRDTKQILGMIRKQPLLDPVENILASQFWKNNDCKSVKMPSHSRQTVFAAATIPDYGRKSIKKWLDYKFPKAHHIKTTLFHHTVPMLDQNFINVEDRLCGGSSIADKIAFSPDDILFMRKKILLEVLRQEFDRENTSGSSVLVFVNSVEMAVNVQKFLADQKFDSAALHKNLCSDDRTAIIDKLYEGTIQVVVSTDIAARGLDTRKVPHVIQFEFASDSVSHIHRIGRTARANATGKVTNLISSENELLVEKIKSAGAGNLDEGFSRRRGLRKKFKKHKKRSQEKSVN